MKKLVLNADDLGFSHGVNQAVADLTARGRISSASFMSYGSIADTEHAEIERTDINIGLHFDLTSPLCPHRKPLSTWLRQSFFRQLSVDDITHIAAEQLAEFEKVWKRAPDFLDGHQHVHQFAQIREGLMAAWRARYPERVPVWRITRPFPGLNHLKAHIIYALGGRSLLRMCTQQHWLHNDSFGGAYGFDSDEARLAQRWAAWLAAAPRVGGLMMCHPGKPDDDAPDDEIAAARVQEWQWLGSEAFGAMLKRCQINVVKWP